MYKEIPCILRKGKNIFTKQGFFGSYREFIFEKTLSWRSYSLFPKPRVRAQNLWKWELVAKINMCTPLSEKAQQNDKTN